MVDILAYLKMASDMAASDIFIGVGRRISFKVNGVLTQQGEEKLTMEDVEAAIKDLYVLDKRDMDKFVRTGDDDFSVPVPDVARFRVNVFRQRGTIGAVIRVVLFNIPNYQDLSIPEEVMSIAFKHHGLALVTGTAGSGKSTTLGCVIDRINKTRNCHILTMEDPIEFLHRDDKSIITQREISEDTESYITALRAALRQAPDIILLGEMRDYETIGTAMTAAETGQLVISTLHTTSAVSTIDRIIDVFPPGQQQQIRVQLAMSLQTVVTQKLLPSKAGGLVPAFEILQVNNAVRNLIRESKTHQIDNVISTSAQEKMVSMDTFIYRLFKDDIITIDTAVFYATEPEQMARRIR